MPIIILQFSPRFLGEISVASPCNQKKRTATTDHLRLDLTTKERRRPTTTTTLHYFEPYPVRVWPSGPLWLAGPVCLLLTSKERSSRKMIQHSSKKKRKMIQQRLRPFATSHSVVLASTSRALFICIYTHLITLVMSQLGPI